MHILTPEISFTCVCETVIAAAEQQQQRLAALINPRSRSHMTLYLEHTHHVKPEEKANRGQTLQAPILAFEHSPSCTHVSLQGPKSERQASRRVENPFLRTHK